MTAAAPILELYGRAGRTLHRPALAAAGCALLAATNLVTVLYAAVGMAQFILPRSAITPLTWTWIDDTVALVAIVCAIAGVVAIFVADVARGHPNPWPRRLLVVSVIAIALVAIILRIGITLRQLVPGILSDYHDYYAHFFYPLEFLGILLNVTSNIFALWYALQIANWFGNRLLWRVTIAIFVAGFVLAAFHLLLLAMIWIEISSGLGSPALSWLLVGYRVYQFGSPIFAVFDVLYFAVIAVRLRRAGRFV